MVSSPKLEKLKSLSVKEGLLFEPTLIAKLTTVLWKSIKIPSES